MNKQELYKLADTNRQRGNTQLAKKYLKELLAADPQHESAWMLLAQVEQVKEDKMRCYERALKINPRNDEARIALIRLRSISPTLPARVVTVNPWEVTTPYKNPKRNFTVALGILLMLSAAAFAFAKVNPSSQLAKAILPATPTSYVQTPAGDVAPETRAEISNAYPEYAPLVDTLIAIAVNSANAGMKDAPERPGAEILPSEDAALAARAQLENSLPQPGTLATISLSEQQMTSWLSMGLQKNPDLPFRDVQVYLRDDRIQIWCMVNGSEDSTSVLLTGRLSISFNGSLYVDLDSLQIGPQTVPAFMVNQAETWLNQILAEKLDQFAPGLRMTSLNISNGLITMSAMR